MAYNVYQGDDLIAEKINDKEYIAEGLTPNTEYSFSVSEIIGNEESEKASVTVKTLPIKVTGVTLSPKTSSAESGTAGERQVSAVVAPQNATNESVTFAIAPTTNGLTVSNSGLIKWTGDVPAGEYTTTVKTTDGGKTDTHVLTLTEPVVDPDPEE